jgi:hypothetical protein
VRIKLDENLGRSIAELFRIASHDVATVHEQDLTSAPDSWIFNACLKESRLTLWRKTSGQLWIVESTRIRQYEPGDSED